MLRQTTAAAAENVSASCNFLFYSGYLGYTYFMSSSLKLLLAHQVMRTQHYTYSQTENMSFKKEQ
jgi:hypothetical protein